MCDKLHYPIEPIIVHIKNRLSWCNQVSIDFKGCAILIANNASASKAALKSLVMGALVSVRPRAGPKYCNFGYQCIHQDEKGFIRKDNFFFFGLVSRWHNKSQLCLSVNRFTTFSGVNLLNFCDKIDCLKYCQIPNNRWFEFKPIDGSPDILFVCMYVIHT